MVIMRAKFSIFYVLYFVFWFLISACNPLASATPAVLPPTPTTRPAPNPEGTAAAFLDAWERTDYAGMYSLLSPLSRDATSLDEFQQAYESVNRIAAVTAVETQLLNALTSGEKAAARFSVTLRTALFGGITREINMPLVLANDAWTISWSESLILPELEPGGVLVADASFPSRANIYDRNGKGLAVQGEAVAIGVRPGQLQDEGAVLNALSPLLGLTPQQLQAKYANAQPDWYVPLGEAAAADVQASLGELANLPGVSLANYTTRFYPFTGAAPQVVGYLSAISPEQLDDYQARGYSGDERVGAIGLEAWGERYLAGTRGGTLSVALPGNRLQLVAESVRQPAQALYATLDRDLQIAAQQVLHGFRGSIIVLDANTGAVLTMASSPTFDPNLFEPTNPNREQLTEVLNDPANPLLNRATQGAYPPGSIFKVTVASAAMLSGLYTRDTVYNCGNTWNGLGANNLKYNWTFGRGIKPPGKIDLVMALATSCNPYFYQAAFDMDKQDADFLPQVAREFGFGTFTQIGQVAEAPGLIPDPAWKLETYNDAWRPGDSVNMGIGQGFVLVTPLQIGQMMAAIRNGGTLYQPQLVDRVAPPGGDPTYKLTPVPHGQLPLSADQLEVIRDGLKAVTTESYGTARFRFLGLEIPVSGKTGTAEDPGGGASHAWFAGYTEANQPNKPDIAMVVMIENVGEGSEYAAPIFRRMVEVYFYGKPSSYLMPWETAPASTPAP